MKKKMILTFAIALLLGTMAPKLDVQAYEHHPRMADQWVIDSVDAIKAGWASEEYFGGEILSGCINERQIIYVLDSGVCTEYIDQFKAAGLLSQDYGNAKSAEAAPVAPTESEPPQGAETVPPAEIQVTEMTAVMYATQNVNLRDGNGTAFQKVGSLSKDQSVTVTGKTSNNWYQIEWNGGKAYVSGKYLSETEPSPEEMAAEVEVEPQTIPPETESAVQETETASVEETLAEEEMETVSEKETLTEEESFSAAPETEAVFKPDGITFSWKIMVGVAAVAAVACMGIVVILKGKKK